jgi:hypothetical protein
LLLILCKISLRVGWVCDTVLSDGSEEAQPGDHDDGVDCILIVDAVGVHYCEQAEWGCDVLVGDGPNEVLALGSPVVIGRISLPVVVVGLHEEGEGSFAQEGLLVAESNHRQGSINVFRDDSSFTNSATSYHIVHWCS